VKSLYKERDARRYIEKYRNVPEDLALRVYTSHLIGADAELVLHGGGNTSVKVLVKNILGEEREVLFVKGSGWDLANIEPKGFVGLELSPLRKLRRLPRLADEEMVNQLRVNAIEAQSPNPSVEALVHAFLPHKYIDHTHADSILVLTNQPNAKEIVEEALGDKVGILPFIMPGFPLAKAAIDFYEKNSYVEALVLLNHGLFTFGDNPRLSYERTIYYVDRAEKYIKKKINKKVFIHFARKLPPWKKIVSSAVRFNQILRGRVAYRDLNGSLRRFLIEVRSSPEILKISLSREAPRLCSTGVLTPDHIIRTKNYPVFIEKVPSTDSELKDLLWNEVKKYVERYNRYFQRNASLRKTSFKKLDPYPRVFLVGGVGLVALGYTRREAKICADLAEHTLQAKIKAESIGTYKSLPEKILFEMEYWSLEQRKLGKRAFLPLQGQVAVVTGAGGPIGLGIADRLISAGAVVALADISKERLKKVEKILVDRYGSSWVETVVMDVRSLKSVEEGYRKISYKLGGIDIVVPNAGIAVVGKIENLEVADFQRVIEVNLTGVFNTIKASIPVFRRQGTGGNIVVISTKNVFAPGAAFGSYSASKAGAHQISKIAALELAELSVRVNLLNPDAIFGEGEIPSHLWKEVGETLMKSRGLSAGDIEEYYRKRNLLKVKVSPYHVGNAVVFFATEQTPTTGATLPIDGGLPAAFPR